MGDILMENLKKCKVCGVEKPTSEYSNHNTTKDRLYYMCKPCYRKKSSERTKKRYRENPEFKAYSNERSRKRYNTVGKEGSRRTAEQIKNDVKKHHQKYPEKRIARILSQTVKSKKPGHEMHHWSYNVCDAKDVIEISFLHHKMIHRFITYDQQFFKYRITKTNELLDTRIKHEEFINYLIETQCAEF